MKRGKKMPEDQYPVAVHCATSSNTQPILSELAERAGRHYGSSTKAWLACGRVLLEARMIAKHGQWGSFLDHAGVPEQTAQRMIRIAKAGLKPITVTGLGGIRATIECLATNADGVAELVSLHEEVTNLREQIAAHDAGLSDEDRARLDEALADHREIRRLKREMGEWQSKHAVSQREINAARRHHRALDHEIAVLTAEAAA